MSPQVGMQPIPGFRLTGRLGQGAFAEVWEADRGGEKFALKFLDTRARRSSQIASEIRVLRSLSQLHHPNIIQLHEVHASGKYVILVMERATCNLADLHEAYLLETGDNMPADHALDLLDQAAVALDFLATSRLEGFPSSRGLQHCDIKPSNLLMCGTRLKVADFGLCAGTGWQTHSNSWKGTFPYAAPELFKGAATTGTDQFALAVTFCEVVMGDRPFWKGSQQGINMLAGPPIDMTKVREKEYPIFSRAFHPYPSSRWPSCSAFLQALRKVVEGTKQKPVTTYRKGSSGMRRGVRA